MFGHDIKSAELLQAEEWGSGNLATFQQYLQGCGVGIREETVALLQQPESMTDVFSEQRFLQIVFKAWCQEDLPEVARLFPAALFRTLFFETVAYEETVCPSCLISLFDRQRLTTFQQKDLHELYLRYRNNISQALGECQGLDNDATYLAFYPVLASRHTSSLLYNGVDSESELRVYIGTETSGIAVCLSLTKSGDVHFSFGLVTGRGELSIFEIHTGELHIVEQKFLETVIQHAQDVMRERKKIGWAMA